MMHADRTNRVMLLLFAILLIAVGVAGALLSFGAFGSEREHRVVIDNRVSRYFGEHGDWLWPVVAVGAVIIGLLALRWLFALLFSTDRIGDLRLSSDRLPSDRLPSDRGAGRAGEAGGEPVTAPIAGQAVAPVAGQAGAPAGQAGAPGAGQAGQRSSGRTVLRSGALTDAVADEVQTYAGVQDAHARLIGDETAPRLVVGATVEDTADLAGLRRRIENDAVAHARAALGDEDLPVQLDLTTTTRKASRVS